MAKSISEIVAELGQSTGPASRTAKLDGAIRRASQEFGVPEALIRAVIRQESGGRPDAVSPAGAQGVMQLLPGTARGLGVRNPFDPEENIRGGTRYLRQQLDAFGGDVTKALAAYNAGPGRVRQYGGVPPFKETQNYVRSIRSMLGDDEEAVRQAVARRAQTPRLASRNGQYSSVVDRERSIDALVRELGEESPAGDPVDALVRELGEESPPSSLKQGKPLVGPPAPAAEERSLAAARKRAEAKKAEALGIIGPPAPPQLAKHGKDLNISGPNVWDWREGRTIRPRTREEKLVRGFSGASRDADDKLTQWFRGQQRAGKMPLSPIVVNAQQAREIEDLERIADAFWKETHPQPTGVPLGAHPGAVAIGRAAQESQRESGRAQDWQKFGAWLQRKGVPLTPKQKEALPSLVAWKTLYSTKAPDRFKAHAIDTAVAAIDALGMVAGFGAGKTLLTRGIGAFKGAALAGGAQRALLDIPENLTPEQRAQRIYQDALLTGVAGGVLGMGGELAFAGIRAGAGAVGRKITETGRAVGDEAAAGLRREGQKLLKPEAAARREAKKIGKAQQAIGRLREFNERAEKVVSEKEAVQAPVQVPLRQAAREAQQKAERAAQSPLAVKPEPVGQGGKVEVVQSPRVEKRPQGTPLKTAAQLAEEKRLAAAAKPQIEVVETRRKPAPEPAKSAPAPSHPKPGDTVEYRDARGKPKFATVSHVVGTSVYTKAPGTKGRGRLLRHDASDLNVLRPLPPPRPTKDRKSISDALARARASLQRAETARASGGEYDGHTEASWLTDADDNFSEAAAAMQRLGWSENRITNTWESIRASVKPAKSAPAAQAGGERAQDILDAVKSVATESRGPRRLFATVEELVKVVPGWAKRRGETAAAHRARVAKEIAESGVGVIGGPGKIEGPSGTVKPHQVFDYVDESGRVHRYYGIWHPDQFAPAPSLPQTGQMVKLKGGSENFQVVIAGTKEIVLKPDTGGRPVRLTPEEFAQKVVPPKGGGPEQSLGMSGGKAVSDALQALADAAWDKKKALAALIDKYDQKIANSALSGAYQAVSRVTADDVREAFEAVHRSLGSSSPEGLKLLVELEPATRKHLREAVAAYKATGSTAPLTRLVSTSRHTGWHATNAARREVEEISAEFARRDRDAFLDADQELRSGSLTRREKALGLPLEQSAWGIEQSLGMSGGKAASDALEALVASGWDKAKAVARLADKYDLEISEKLAGHVLQNVGRLGARDRAAFDAEIAKHPNLKPHAEAIWQQAQRMAGKAGSTAAAPSAPAPKASSGKPAPTQAPVAAAAPNLRDDKYIGSINVLKMNLDEQAQIALQGLYEATPQMEQVRRTGTSVAEIKAGARKLEEQIAAGKRQDLSDEALGKWGTGKGVRKAEEMEYVQGRTKAVVENYVRLKSEYEAAGLKATEEMRLKVLEAELQAQWASVAAMGTASEAGRILGILARMRGLYNQAGKTNKQKLEDKIKELYDEAGLTPAIRKAIDEADENDPIALGNILRKAALPKLPDRWKNYIRTDMLSGAKTHERNIGGSALQAPLKHAANFAEILFDRRGPNREVRLSEATAALLAYRNALPRAARNFQEIMKYGFTEEQAKRFDIPRFIEWQGQVPLGKGRNLKVLPNKLNPFNLVPKAMVAEDMFFRTLMYQSEAARLAARKAAKEGLKHGTEAWDNRVHYLAQTDPEIRELAELAARRHTFNAEPDEVTRKIIEVRDALDRVTGRFGVEVPLGSMVMPFVNTPANVLKEGIRYSPAGWMRLVGWNRLTPAQRREVAAEATVGTGLFAGLTVLALTTEITGYPPQEENARQAFFASGRRPYQIVLGGKTFSYQNLGSITTILASLAALKEEYWSKKKPAPGDEVFRLIFQTGRTFLDQSYASGTNAFLSAIEDPKRFAEQSLAMTIGAHVPLSGFLREQAAVRDPHERATAALPSEKSNISSGILTETTRRIQSGIPLARESLRPRLDAFGRIMPKRPGGAWELQPWYQGAVRKDPVDEELHALRVFPGKPEPVVSLPQKGKSVQVNLSPEVYDAYVTARGLNLHRRLEIAMASPRWKALTEDRRRQRIAQLTDQESNFWLERLKNALKTRKPGEVSAWMRKLGDKALQNKAGKASFTQ